MAFTGGGGATNTGNIFIALKPLNERKIAAPDIINRIRPQLNRLPVASTFLQASQDLRIGGRGSSALYQYTLQSDNPSDLAIWGPRILAEMKHLPVLQDVNTDQQNGGLDSSPQLRPCHRRQTRPDRAITRSGNLCLLRPVRNFHHLHPAEPVLRSPRSCPAVFTKPRRPEKRLLPLEWDHQRHLHRQCSPHRHDLQPGQHHSALPQSHQSLSLRHPLLQSRSRRSAQRRHPRHRADEAAYWRTLVLARLSSPAPCSPTSNPSAANPS